MGVNTRDTSPAVAAIQLAVYRRMTATQRGDLAFELCETARALALDGIRARHPHYVERQTRQALFRMLLGDDLYCKVWPGEPLLAP
jgi:hypothetical protein